MRTKEAAGKQKEKKNKRKKRIFAGGLWLLAGITGISVFAVMKVLAAAKEPAAEDLVQVAAKEQERPEERSEAVWEEKAVSQEINKEQEVPVIYIDPGHGGVDDGCVSEGIREKDINLQIARLAEEKLKEKGYSVKLSRGADVYISKEDRVKDANEKGALIYVSIHQNFCEDENAMGIETWYDASDTERDSKRLAQLIHKETVKKTEAAEREIWGESELYVTGKTTMPSCLIETGFLSNAKERSRLITGEYQEEIAEGITEGIDLYFHPKTMYLTFDDGPSADNTDLILDVLKEKNVKATFFVIGEYVRKYPETAKRIAAEGHTIGIHCDVHDYDILYQSADSYIEDFEKAYETVFKVTGVRAELFRFPGGSVNAYNKKVCQEIVEEMEKRGFVYFDWNASIEDAAGKKEQEELLTSARETTLGRKKVVLLAHDRVTNTALCLGELIDGFPEYQMKPLTAKVEPVQFGRFWEAPAS